MRKQNPFLLIFAGILLACYFDFGEMLSDLVVVLGNAQQQTVQQNTAVERGED